MTTTEATFVSRYERRVHLVQDIVRKHTELDDTASAALATEMVRVIDTVPEQLR
ncbi:DUF6307 family protein [Actinokineospora sp. HUAS TT18]|uniref:DUF6307 family protein n=1 Tax=Actinokineospora sp. HUAS TT18 TaxID=3447451 RepID=UPI003F5261B4